jgi:hypothetical protein
MQALTQADEQVRAQLRLALFFERVSLLALLVQKCRY